MAKTAIVRARTEKDTKKSVETILENLGMNTAQAINLFFRQVILHRGLPFPVKMPNKTTRETFKKTDEGREIVKCKDIDDMFRKLGI